MTVVLSLVMGLHSDKRDFKEPIGQTSLIQHKLYSRLQLQAVCCMHATFSSRECWCLLWKNIVWLPLRKGCEVII